MGGKLITFGLVIMMLLYTVSCTSYTQEKVTEAKPVVNEKPLEATVSEKEETIISEDNEPPIENLPVQEEVSIAKEKDEHLIKILEKGFEPRFLTINAEETVVFNNTDFGSGQLHTLVGWKKDQKDIRFKSGRIDYGQEVKQAFSKRGTYTVIDVGIEEEERELFGATIEVN